MAEDCDSSSDDDRLVIKMEGDDIPSNRERDVDKLNPSRKQYKSDHCRLCQSELEGMKDSACTDKNKSFLCHLCREQGVKNDVNDMNSVADVQQSQHVCFFCQENFPDKFSLSVHLLSLHHCAYWCHICMEAFSYKSVYLVHLRNHKVMAKHSSDVDKKSPSNTFFKCDFCRKKFSHQRSLDVHRKKHLIKEKRQSNSLNGNEQSPHVVSISEPVEKRSRKVTGLIENLSAEYYPEESYIKSKPVGVTAVKLNTSCPSTRLNLNNIKSERLDVTPVELNKSCPSVGCNLYESCMESEPLDVTGCSLIDESCIKSEPVELTPVKSDVACCLSDGCGPNGDTYVESGHGDTSLAQGRKRYHSPGYGLTDKPYIKSEPVDTDWSSSNENCPSAEYNHDTPYIKSEPVDITSSIQKEVNQDHDSKDIQYFGKPEQNKSFKPFSSSILEKVVEVVQKDGRDVAEKSEQSFTKIVERKNSSAVTMKALAVTCTEEHSDQNTGTSKKPGTQTERGGIAVNFIKQYPYVLKKKETETNGIKVNGISISDELISENIRKTNPSDTSLNVCGVNTVIDNYGDMYIESSTASKTEIIPTTKSKILSGIRAANITLCHSGQADQKAVNSDAGYRTICKRSIKNEINHKNTIPFRVNLINSNNPKPVEGTFDCPKCGVKFNSEEMFRTHWKLHGIEKRFRCDLCNQPFSRNITLVRHRRTHFK